MRNQKRSLTFQEKRIVKALFKRGWKGQDILTLINIGRNKSINVARIYEVKKDKNIEPASEKEVNEYIKIQNNWDLKRKINPYVHERIYKSLEAMRCAIQIFNNPNIKFKSEIFCVLSVIAWTYILQEYYSRNGIKIEKDGKYFSLKKLLNKHECPLSEAQKLNLKNIIEIRDKVEHRMLKDADALWLSLFQSNCLNYNNFIKKEFWEEISLDDIGYALQFAKMEKGDIKVLQDYDIPEYIKIIDKEMMEEAKSKNINESSEYRMKIIVTYVNSGPYDSAIEFVSPESAMGKDIQRILVKERIADDKYPYKPKEVCDIIKKKTRKNFSLYDHTQAWKRHRVRPPAGSDNPSNTNRKYCIYHKAHGDYTYNDRWIELLINEILQRSNS